MTVGNHDGQRGGAQFVTIIPERDVYRLIMRSRLKSAEKFEEWVVGDVIPSIRTHCKSPKLLRTGETPGLEINPRGITIIPSGTLCRVLGYANGRDAVSTLDEDEKNTVVIADGNRGNPNLTIINIQVRIVDQNGDPWFVAADVCRVLGILNGPSSVALLDDDERATIHIMDGTTNRGGSPVRTIINESGLYSLVLRSRRPEAKAFKKWITSEVLPSIRKKGTYIHETITGQEVMKLAQAMMAAEERQKALESQVEYLAPPATVGLSRTKDMQVMGIQDVAHFFGVGGEREQGHDESIS